MFFAALCLDKPDGLPIRMETRPAHLEHLKAHAKQIRVAGPLLKDDGETPKGSLLIIEAGTIEAAQAIVDADPYAKAGLFSSVTVSPWKWVIGNPDA
ncbi:MAG: YciI family protein [Tepidamorphaceae bacterium]